MGRSRGPPGNDLPRCGLWARFPGVPLGQWAGGLCSCGQEQVRASLGACSLPAPTWTRLPEPGPRRCRGPGTGLLHLQWPGAAEHLELRGSWAAGGSGDRCEGAAATPPGAGKAWRADSACGFPAAVASMMPTPGAPPAASSRLWPQSHHPLLGQPEATASPQPPKPCPARGPLGSQPR